MASMGEERLRFNLGHLRTNMDIIPRRSPLSDITIIYDVLIFSLSPQLPPSSSPLHVFSVTVGRIAIVVELRIFVCKYGYHPKKIFIFTYDHNLRCSTLLLLLSFHPPLLIPNLIRVPLNLHVGQSQILLFFLRALILLLLNLRIFLRQV